MLRRVVIGVAMACLMSGAAYAVDEEMVDNECTRAAQRGRGGRAEQDRRQCLERGRRREGQPDARQADALCTEGKFKDASAALGTSQRDGRQEIAALPKDGTACRPPRYQRASTRIAQAPPVALP